MKTTKRNRELVEYVEELVSHGDITYIEAICEYCAEKGLDPAAVKRLIPKPMKERIEAEAIKFNYIKSDLQELPLDD